MSAAKDAIGAEHFPRCHCFDESEERSDHMYALANGFAELMHMNMSAHGYCAPVLPYLLALVGQMTMSRVACEMADDQSSRTIQAHLRELHARLAERQTALLARSEKISLAGPGVGSVQ